MEKFVKKEDFDRQNEEIQKQQLQIKHLEAEINQLKNQREEIIQVVSRCIKKEDLILLENIRHDSWRRLTHTDQGKIEWEIQNHGWHREEKLGYVIKTEIIEGKNDE
jgi:hypothetical protein